MNETENKSQRKSPADKWIDVATQLATLASKVDHVQSTVNGMQDDVSTMRVGLGKIEEHQKPKKKANFLAIAFLLGCFATFSAPDSIFVKGTCVVVKNVPVVKAMCHSTKKQSGKVD